MKNSLILLVLLASLAFSAPHAALAATGGSCSISVYPNTPIEFWAQGIPSQSNSATFNLITNDPAQGEISNTLYYSGYPPTRDITGSFSFANPGTYKVYAQVTNIQYTQPGGTNTSTLQLNSGNQSVWANGNDQPTCIVTVNATPKPDLVPGSGQTIYATVGQNVTIPASVTNQGSASAGSFVVGFTTSAGASQVTSVGSLAIGASQDVSTQLPTSSYGAGTYSYQYCVDQYGNVTESNEGNNCASGQIIFSPPPSADLYASDVAATHAIVGQNVSLSVPVYNRGNSNSGSFPVQFLSADGSMNLDSGYTSLAPGNSTTVTINYTFQSPGTYYVKACANHTTSGSLVVGDSNGGNDCSPDWTAITVYGLPGATISVNPTSVAYGGSATVTWSCSNATSCAGTNFNTGNAMSGSATVSATNNTTYSVWSNGPGGTSSASATLSVGQPYPDVVATAGPAVTGLVGNPTSLSGTITNIGNAAMSGPFSNAIQICDNNCATYNQTISGQMATLASGASQGMALSISLPNIGNYYYRACADTNSSWNQPNNESNEGNNCSDWQSIVISGADFTAGTVSPSTATAGIPVTFSAYIQNIGNADPGGFPVLFQILNGDVFDSGYIDTHAGSGATASASHTFTSGGTYQIRACADRDTSWNGIVPQSNYDNDCGNWTTVTVGPPWYPDLYPGSALEISVILGNPVTINGTVTNQGQANTGASFKNLFKVIQNQNGSWATVQGGTNAGALAPGASAAITSTFPASAFPAVGSYAYQYCVNEDVNNGWAHSVTEAPGDNNDCSAVGTIDITPPPPPAPKCPGTPSVTLSSNQKRVAANSTVKLTWGAANTDQSCTLTGSDGETFTLPTGECTEGNSGAPLVTQPIVRQTVFTLSCGTAGQAKTTVNVVPRFGEF